MANNIKRKCDGRYNEGNTKIVYTSLEQVYNDIRVSIDINPNSLL